MAKGNSRNNRDARRLSTILPGSTKFRWTGLVRFRFWKICEFSQSKVGVPGLRRRIDPQVFGLYGFAKADAQTTLSAKVPANIKNIQLLREAYHSL